MTQLETTLKLLPGEIGGKVTIVIGEVLEICLLILFSLWHQIFCRFPLLLGPPLYLMNSHLFSKVCRQSFTSAVMLSV